MASTRSESRVGLAYQRNALLRDPLGPFSGLWSPSGATFCRAPVVSGGSKVSSAGGPKLSDPLDSVATVQLSADDLAQRTLARQFPTVTGRDGAAVLELFRLLGPVQSQV